jgi:hypothetical protein
MKKLIVNLCLFSCIILFYQCHKDSDNQAGKNLGTISFSPQDRMIVPYNGGETITFKDTLGKLVHLHVFNPRSKEYTDDPQNQSNGTGDFYEVERDVIYADSTFTIYLTQSSPFDQLQGKFINIDVFAISSHPEIPGEFTGFCRFNAGQLFTEPSGNIIVSFYDSLKILNKKFNSVYDLSAITLTPNDGSEAYSNLYYSVTQGFVGVKTSKGRRWCLN